MKISETNSRLGPVRPVAIQRMVSNPSEELFDPVQSAKGFSQAQRLLLQVGQVARSRFTTAEPASLPVAEPIGEGDDPAELAAPWTDRRDVALPQTRTGKES